MEKFLSEGMLRSGFDELLEPETAQAFVLAEESLKNGDWEQAKAICGQVASSDDWRPQWGILLAGTEDLTEFSRFPSVAENARSAFENMDADVCRELCSRYGARLRSACESLGGHTPPVKKRVTEKTYERKIYFWLAGLLIAVALIAAGAYGKNTPLLAVGCVLSALYLLFTVVFGLYWLKRRVNQMQRLADCTPVLAAFGRAALFKNEEEKRHAALSAVEYMLRNLNAR